MLHRDRTAHQAILISSTPGQFENDCACPDHPRIQIDPAGVRGLFSCEAQALSARLAGDFYLLFSPYAPQGPSVLNRPAWERWRTFSSPAALQQPLDYRLAQQALLQPVGRWSIPSEPEPHTLTAWMHVTNACNLDCPYCYVRKSTEHMPGETGLRALDQIFHTAQVHGFRAVKLKYAGGEASLHFKLIRELHRRARWLAQRNGLELQAVVLSNGVRILPQDADWLVENQVRVMVSLDGVGAVHDRLRVHKNGASSFERVSRTIERVLLPRGLKPYISITLTRLNAHGAADAARWALERDLPVSLNFYRQNPLTIERRDLVLEEEAIIAGMRAAYAVFEAFLPSRPFLNGLLDRVQHSAHANTCGAGLAYLVIDHHGRVAQCQMHLEEAQSPAGQLDLLPLVHRGSIRNLPVDEKQGCRDCAYRYRCSGGCPIETYRATGRWDVQSPNCHIYQALLPEALRLEGLRLLKVHGLLPTTLM